jgi:chromate transporter
MSLLALFLLFLRVGFFTFGGGYAMVPLLRGELVAAGLMTAREAADMVALAELTPGPFAVNAATFSGMRLFGVPGALAATAGACLPSVAVSLLAALLFKRVQGSRALTGALSGARPAVLGLITAAALLMARDTLLPASGPDIPGLAIFAAGIVFTVFIKRVPPIAVLAISGLLGAAYLR